MFHAINARKARLEDVSGDAKRHPREDLVTSSLFGTIRFMDSEAQIQALALLTGGIFAVGTEIILWPRFWPRTGHWIEPDVVLRDGDAFWLVEVKWGSHFSRPSVAGDEGEGRPEQEEDSQIDRQIGALRSGYSSDEEFGCQGLPPKPRKIVGFTLLGAEPRHATDFDRSKKNAPEGRQFESLPWPEVTTKLHHVVEDNTNPGFVAWAKSAKDFLMMTNMGVVLGPWPDYNAVSPAHFTYDLAP